MPPRPDPQKVNWNGLLSFGKKEKTPLFAGVNFRIRPEEYGKYKNRPQ